MCGPKESKKPLIRIKSLQKIYETWRGRARSVLKGKSSSALRHQLIEIYMRACHLFVIFRFQYCFRIASLAFFWGLPLMVTYLNGFLMMSRPPASFYAEKHI